MQFTAVCRAQVKGKKFFQNKSEAIRASCDCNPILGTLHFKHMHEIGALADSNHEVWNPK